VDTVQLRRGKATRESLREAESRHDGNGATKLVFDYGFGGTEDRLLLTKPGRDFFSMLSLLT